MARSKPALYDPTAAIAAGIDPRTGLPIKMKEHNDKGSLHPELKKLFRIKDEQDAVNRYQWYNLPSGLTSQLIERILYYRGQAALFYMPDAETWYFLPYALSDTIDVYGRYTGITPLPFNGASRDPGTKEKPWIVGLERKPIYEVILPEDLTIKDFENDCVLLKDYTEQQSQQIIARQQLQEPLLDLMADDMCFMRTAMLNATGVEGMRINNEDEYDDALEASQSINRAGLVGDKFVPIVGTQDFQPLTGSTLGRSEDFLLTLQGIDNLRKGFLGIGNEGVYQKKAHMLQSEQEMNAAQVDSVLQDGLAIRQNFCNLANSIWGLGIWCEASETATGADKNMDGEVSNEQDGQVEADNPAAGGEKDV